MKAIKRYRLCLQRHKGQDELCGLYARDRDAAWDIAFTFLEREGFPDEDEAGGRYVVRQVRDPRRRLVGVAPSPAGPPGT